MAQYIRKWHGAVCQEVTQRLKIVGPTSMTTIVSVAPAHPGRKWTHHDCGNWLWKCDKTQSETYRLYMSCPSEMHTTVSMTNCNTAKCVHVQYEDVWRKGTTLTFRDGCLTSCIVSRSRRTSSWNPYWEAITYGTVLPFVSGVRLSSLVLRPVVAVGRNWVPCYRSLL
jgi:hypothetical protein